MTDGKRKFLVKLTRIVGRSQACWVEVAAADFGDACKRAIRFSRDKSEGWSETDQEATSHPVVVECRDEFGAEGKGRRVPRDDLVGRAPE